MLHHTRDPKGQLFTEIKNFNEFNKRVLAEFKKREERIFQFIMEEIAVSETAKPFIEKIETKDQVDLDEKNSKVHKIAIAEAIMSLAGDEKPESEIKNQTYETLVNKSIKEYDTPANHMGIVEKYHKVLIQMQKMQMELAHRNFDSSGKIKEVDSDETNYLNSSEEANRYTTSAYLDNIDFAIENIREEQLNIRHEKIEKFTEFDQKNLLVMQDARIAQITQHYQADVLVQKENLTKDVNSLKEVAEKYPFEALAFQEKYLLALVDNPNILPIYKKLIAQEIFNLQDVQADFKKASVLYENSSVQQVSTEMLAHHYELIRHQEDMKKVFAHTHAFIGDVLSATGINSPDTKLEWGRVNAEVRAFKEKTGLISVAKSKDKDSKKDTTVEKKAEIALTADQEKDIRAFANNNQHLLSGIVTAMLPQSFAASHTPQMAPKTSVSEVKKTLKSGGP